MTKKWPLYKYLLKNWTHLQKAYVHWLFSLTHADMFLASSYKSTDSVTDVSPKRSMEVANSLSSLQNSDEAISPWRGQSNMDSYMKDVYRRGVDYGMCCSYLCGIKNCFTSGFYWENWQFLHFIFSYCLNRQLIPSHSLSRKAIWILSHTYTNRCFIYCSIYKTFFSAQVFLAGIYASKTQNLLRYFVIVEKTITY